MIYQESPEVGPGGSAQKRSDNLKNRELDRQRIEKELQRQRMIAIGGRRQRQEPAGAPSVPPSQDVKAPEQVGKDHLPPAKPDTTAPRMAEVSAGPTPPSPSEEKTIIRIKKRQPQKEEGAEQTGERVSDPSSGNGLDLVNHPTDYLVEAIPEERKIGLKDLVRQARDDILKGKLVLKKEMSHVKDDALLHTDLKTRKSPAGDGTGTGQLLPTPKRTDTAPPPKKRDRPEADDDDGLS
jgi:hypothetical protein